MKQTIYNFKDRFAEPVETGAKTSTIRLFLKTEPPEIGDRLKMFNGMRTKKCRKLREDTCQACLPISISDAPIILGGRKLTAAEEMELAVNDGFTNAAELRAFFRRTYGFPLPGKPHWVSWRKKP